MLQQKHVTRKSHRNGIVHSYTHMILYMITLASHAQLRTAPVVMYRPGQH